MRHPPPSDRRYSERQWVPWWMYPIGFAAGAALILLIVGVLSVIHGRGPSIIAVVLAAGGMGLFFALLIIFSRGLITLDDRELSVCGEHMPVTSIVSIRELHGRQADRARWDIGSSRSAASSAGLLATAIPGLAAAGAHLGVGIDMLTGINRRRGLRASIWQRSGLLLLTPDQRTQIWLVATRQPQELAAAIEQAITDAGGHPPTVSLAAPASQQLVEQQ